DRILTGNHLGDLLRGDVHEESPQVVAVVKLRDAAALDRVAKTVEGAQRHILAVDVAARSQPRAGGMDESPEVSLPEGLDGPGIARPQVGDPLRDRVFVELNFGHQTRLLGRGRRFDCVDCNRKRPSEPTRYTLLGPKKDELALLAVGPFRQYPS